MAFTYSHFPSGESNNATFPARPSRIPKTIESTTNTRPAVVFKRARL